MELGKEMLHMFTVKQDDTKNVLASFERMVTRPSKELKEYGVTKEDIKRGKCIIMHHIVNQQIEKENRFKIEHPFANPCTECHGAGELYKFTRKKINVKCRDCNGEGHQIDKECKSCNDEGRYVKMMGGVRINVVCKNCKGTKKPICRTCWGEGTVKTTVLERIATTTTCSRCKGLGFFPPKKLNNPLMDKTLGDVIKDKIQAAEDERTDVCIELLQEEATVEKTPDGGHRICPQRTTVG